MYLDWRYFSLKTSSVWPKKRGYLHYFQADTIFSHIVDCFKHKSKTRHYWFFFVFSPIFCVFLSVFCVFCNYIHVGTIWTHLAAQIPDKTFSFSGWLLSPGEPALLGFTSLPCLLVMLNTAARLIAVIKVYHWYCYLSWDWFTTNYLETSSLK